MNLTPEQTEELVVVMARAFSGAPFPSHRSRDKARAALTAALPVIERAVLERASEVARHYDDDLNHCTGMFDSLADQLLALAEEAR